MEWRWLKIENNVQWLFDEHYRKDCGKNFSPGSQQIANYTKFSLYWRYHSRLVYNGTLPYSGQSLWVFVRQIRWINNAEKNDRVIG